MEQISPTSSGSSSNHKIRNYALGLFLLFSVASQFHSPLVQLYGDTTHQRVGAATVTTTAAAPVEQTTHSGRSNAATTNMFLQNNNMEEQRRTNDQTMSTTTTADAAIPLTKLVQTEPETTCQGENMVLIDDVIIDYEHAYSRTIPRIVHITSKSRCVHKAFHDVLEQWKFENHGFFYHNDAAVDRLLNKDWPEFPLLPQIVHCLKSGAAKIDLWRALLLYEYGGIYTDMDNAPAAFNGTFDERDEAFFVVEMGGWLSQYFFASAPKHPLMWQLVHQTMMRLYVLNDVPSQYVPRITGPGALKHAFIHFMSDQGPNDPNCNQNHRPKYDKVTAGFYRGFQNATVTVVGTKENANEYVFREAVRRKKGYYKDMNMTHFSDVQENDHVTCIQRIYNRHHHLQPDKGGYWQQLKMDSHTAMTDYYQRRRW